jgi:hypothetical protein
MLVPAVQFFDTSLVDDPLLAEKRKGDVGVDLNMFFYLYCDCLPIHIAVD